MQIHKAPQESHAISEKEDKTSALITESLAEKERGVFGLLPSLYHPIRAIYLKRMKEKYERVSYSYGIKESYPFWRERNSSLFR